MARSTPFCDAYIDIRTTFSLVQSISYRTKSILDVELYMYDMISAKHLLARTISALPYDMLDVNVSLSCVDVIHVIKKSRSRGYKKSLS